MLDVDERETTQENLAALDATVQKAQACVLNMQYPEGYWWGELESNPTMEAEYLLLTHFLGVGDRERWGKLARRIISRQRDDGTWGQFYEAPGDLSTSTECYFALKMAGYSADEPFMRKAREFILSKGGVPRTRIFTKIWLALLGQWDWKGVPVLPPELMLLPNWFPVNIYDFASWARATIVPMTILLERKPVRPVPEWAQLNELYPQSRSETDYSLARPKRLVGWEGLFYAGDTAVRQLQKLPWKPTREQGIRRAERWILEHQEADGSWGGIQPPWVYSLMALSSLDYRSDHPVIAKGLAGFDTFAIEENDTLRIQACISPLWDTGLAMIALVDSGIRPDHQALVRAGEWLLGEQNLNGGDWQVKAKGVPPGGWAFEFHNNVYPDLDDTAEIVMALNKVSLPSGSTKRWAIDRAVQWIMGMQSENGGWGAFDKDNTKSFIARIPFADFGETIDPPSVDVTAHILEMLGQLGYRGSDPRVGRGLDYILSEQEDDGPWFGRWGVNYIYGSGAVLPALEALDTDMSAEYVARTVRWLVEHQNSDGGWGESCVSYVDPAHRGRGPSTASQTSWALMAMLSASEGSHPATRRGVEHLVRTQRDDGSWDEPYFTGTGFPGYGVGQRPDRHPGPSEPGYQGPELPAGFMINYHMYRNYWPLTALGRYRTFLAGGGPPSKGSPESREIHAVARRRGAGI
jgi:squalene-hopene/tetraprenyl-beta-curcumene cyclase